MVREFEIKQLMVDIGRRMWQRGFVAANDGNITVKINDHELLTTPTGVSKGFMTTDMMVKVDLEGRIVSSHSFYKPSSELKMHIEVYKERPDVNSVVHAHPPYATAFAVAGIPLDKCVLPEAILSIGAVPIAEFGLPSTMEIPEKIRPHLKSSDALLLQNHGALAMGSDLLNAYFKLETLEHSAHIIWNALQLGHVNVLPEKERDRLLELKQKLNLPGQTTACDSAPFKLGEAPSSPRSEEISPEMIREITRQVIEKLKQ